MDKLAALNEILQLDPANAFARYGLAMEHLSQGHPDAALAEFATCIEKITPYIHDKVVIAECIKAIKTRDAKLEESCDDKAFPLLVAAAN